MSIGTITVDLLARTGSFETDMNRSAKLAEKRAKEIDAAVTKAGAAIGVAFTAAGVAALAMARHIIDGLDALNDVKDATGASIENISALEDVALRTGTTLDNVSGILVKFNSALKEADGKNGVSQALKAIGLDAEELKKLDPAEALRQTAVALTGFADDGNKARLVQELFGKSIKEAAPFLNDLAEQTKLVGKVTAEQTAEAERFNKQLAEMSKNALDAKRVLLSELLPAVTRLTSELIEGQKAFGGFFSALVEVGMKTNPFDGWGENAKKANAEVQRLTSEIDRLQKGGRLITENGGGAAFVGPGGGDAARSRLAAAQRELESAQKRKAYFDTLIAKAVTPEAERLEAAYYGGNKPTVGDLVKPSKGGGGKDNSAAQEAKAQLAQDLEDMKKNTALLATAFDNDEKILSAKRAASLISDAEYFSKKRDIIVATGEVEEAGLQASIDRLKREQATLTGKDAIDNQRKLNDAEAELRKSRAETATQLTTLNIEAEASAKRLTTSMEDARAAAQSLLDVTNRARALELAGMGRGSKQRDFDAAINQIEQTYEQKRQDLERDRRNNKFAGREDDYKRELALLEEFQKKSIDSYVNNYAAIEAKQRDFLLGASEGARNYADEARNAYKETADAVKSAFGSMEDSLVEFAKTGKLDFKSLIDSILADIARLVVRTQITGPLAKMVGDALGGGSDPLERLLSSNNAFGTAGAGGSSWVGELFSGIGKIFGGFFADGGSPPVGKVSIVGERGPEMFVPNTAGKVIPNHLLGGGGPPVSVVINNTVGDVATASMLRESQVNTERRIAAAFGRQSQYGNGRV
ncbi:phage tail tape measure protein [uncultured Variovorax sp.]|uniref:phage tail tape measure protein n=1 Tax=uncultured Variovorax sp. TaxID=114708 RepID=UPI0025DF4631|nr:phage tail tape measure protein [uncultured Variovorax sp.]